jgi:hypothetical protein
MGPAKARISFERSEDCPSPSSPPFLILSEVGTLLLLLQSSEAPDLKSRPGSISTTSVCACCLLLQVVVVVVVVVAIRSGYAGYCAKKKRKERPNQSDVPARERSFVVSRLKSM